MIHVSNPQKNNFKLKQGNYTDNRNNLITDPSLETNINGWRLDWASRGTLSYNATNNNILGNFGIRMNNDGLTMKYSTQIINVSGNKGDTFIFGGWVYSYAQPNNFQSEKFKRMSLLINDYYNTKYEIKCVPSDK